MPETQNLDPVSFNRVHDNYRTLDEGAKVGSFPNVLGPTQPLSSRTW